MRKFLRTLLWLSDVVMILILTIIALIGMGLLGAICGILFPLTMVVELIMHWFERI